MHHKWSDHDSHHGQEKYNEPVHRADWRPELKRQEKQSSEQVKPVQEQQCGTHGDGNVTVALEAHEPMKRQRVHRLMSTLSADSKEQQIPRETSRLQHEGPELVEVREMAERLM